MRTKHQFFAIAFLAMMFVAAVSSPAGAMHIMEGYLPAGYCVTWSLLSLPFFVLGLAGIKKKLAEDPKNIVMLSICGAFVFFISSLKIPSMTGSCSHMTGTGLGAILFGPCAMAVLGVIVLVFQAVMLAHGGLTTLGANTFSMAIAGPLVSWLIYTACTKLRVSRRVGVFAAAALGDLFTYCVTAVQLALAYPSAVGGVPASAAKFLLVFAPTQLPLAILEGVLTVAVMVVLENYAVKDLNSVGYSLEVA